MGFKATPGRMRAALEAIASGSVAAIGASSIVDAFPQAVKTARAGLALCRHCRDDLLSRCRSCDQIHPTACCCCSDCLCACHLEAEPEDE